MSIQVQLVCSPEYILVTSSIDQEKGIETVKKAVEAIQAEIKKQGGDCVVKTEVSFFFCVCFTSV